VMRWVDRVGDRRSYAILERNFSVEKWGEARRKEKVAKRKEQRAYGN
jgi:chaperone required for assembly of F1-ATPase